MIKINAMNAGSESWTGMGVVTGFGAVVLILQGPHMKKGDAHWRITLLQILQEVRSICKTRNHLASMADFLLIPCRPSAFDLAAIESSVQIAKAVERPAAFVLNACPARAPEVAEARDVLESYAFPVAPVLIGQRTAFSRAVASGRSVTEFEAEGKAAEEIVQLWKWIRQQIGEKHGS